MKHGLVKKSCLSKGHFQRMNTVDLLMQALCCLQGVHVVSSCLCSGSVARWLLGQHSTDRSVTL